MLLVYGIPILTIGLIWESTILERALNNTYKALKLGLRFYGTFMALGIIIVTAILLLLTNFDPTTVNLLNRPNPALNTSPTLAWIMVWVSILIVGPAEEYIFRGFLYGWLLSLFKGRHWQILAFISSVLFAASHIYYAIVYGLASLIPFRIIDF